MYSKQCTQCERKRERGIVGFSFNSCRISTSSWREKKRVRILIFNVLFFFFLLSAVCRYTFYSCDPFPFRRGGNHTLCECNRSAIRRASCFLLEESDGATSFLSGCLFIVWMTIFYVYFTVISTSQSAFFY